MIRVTNKSGNDLHDRFNGKDYSFPNGSSVVVPLIVAKHVFGLAEGDKTNTFARLGWMRTNSDLEEATRRLATFTFSSPETVEEVVPVPAAAKEQGLAPLQHGADVKAATDGAVESSVPMPPRGSGSAGSTIKAKRSVLTQLSGG